MEKSLETQFFLNFIHLGNNSKISKIKKTLGQSLTNLFYETLKKHKNISEFLQNSSISNSHIFYKGIELETINDYENLKNDINSHLKSCCSKTNKEKLNIFEAIEVNLIKTNLTKSDKTNRLLSVLVHWQVPVSFPDRKFHYFFMYPLKYGNFHK